MNRSPSNRNRDISGEDRNEVNPSRIKQPTKVRRLSPSKPSSPSKEEQKTRVKQSHADFLIPIHQVMIEEITSILDACDQTTDEALKAKIASNTEAW